jgi:hypothetical protein
MGRLQRTEQLARMEILGAEAVATGLVPEGTRLQGRDHAFQTHGLQFFDRLIGKHRE